MVLIEDSASFIFSLYTLLIVFLAGYFTISFAILRVALHNAERIFLPTSRNAENIDCVFQNRASFSSLSSGFSDRVSNSSCLYEFLFSSFSIFFSSFLNSSTISFATSLFSSSEYHILSFVEVWSITSFQSNLSVVFVSDFVSDFSGFSDFSDLVSVFVSDFSGLSSHTFLPVSSNISFISVLSSSAGLSFLTLSFSSDTHLICRYKSARLFQTLIAAFFILLYIGEFHSFLLKAETMSSHHNSFKDSLDSSVYVSVSCNRSNNHTIVFHHISIADWNIKSVH
jgi:hypothetical protein